MGTSHATDSANQKVVFEAAAKAAATAQVAGKNSRSTSDAANSSAVLAAANLHSSAVAVSRALDIIHSSVKNAADCNAQHVVDVLETHQELVNVAKAANATESRQFAGTAENRSAWTGDNVSAGENAMGVKFRMINESNNCSIVAAAIASGAAHNARNEVTSKAAAITAAVWNASAKAANESAANCTDSIEVQAAATTAAFNAADAHHVSSDATPETENAANSAAKAVERAAKDCLKKNARNGQGSTVEPSNDKYNFADKYVFARKAADQISSKAAKIANAVTLDAIADAKAAKKAKRKEPKGSIGYSHIQLIHGGIHFKAGKECFVTVMGAPTIEQWMVGPQMDKRTLMFSAGHEQCAYGAKYNSREIGAVHSGLAEKWASIRRGTLKGIQKAFKSKTCKTLTVAGFGTGGALASMLVLDLVYSVPAFMENITDPMRSHFNPHGIKLITFSEPRMFGTALAQELDRSFIQKERWLTDGDPLPGLIPTSAKYRHWGLPMVLSESKNWFQIQRQVCGKVASIIDGQLGFKSACENVTTSVYKSAYNLKMEAVDRNYAPSGGTTSDLLGRALNKEIDAMGVGLKMVENRTMCAFDLLS